MKTSRFLFFFLCVMSVSPALSAQPAYPLQELLQRVQQNGSQIQSFSCTFSQERHLSLFPRPVLFHGTLQLVRPDRLRWAFTDPIPSVLIFNGEKGVRCQEDSQPIHFELATDPIMRAVARQLWGWLNNEYSQLQKQYTIERTGPSTLTITPLDPTTAEMISSIMITFDQTNYHPQTVIILEPEGDSTHITFRDYRLNLSLPASTFTDCSPRD